MSDDEDSGKRAGKTKPGKTRTAKGMADEVRLTRRVLVGWLLAGTPALAQVTAQTRAPQVMKPAVTGRTEPLQVQRFDPDKLVFTAATDVTQFTLLRPADLVVLHVRLVNMVVTGSKASRQIKRTGTPALMIVEHQPQSIIESTWPDTAGQDMPKVQRDGTATGKDSGKAGPISKNDIAQTFIAGPSRLVYIMPDGLAAMGYTAAEVLGACATWKLNLDSRAGTVPSSQIMPQAHSFDRIRNRLIAVANAQKADLHSYDPSVEPLLNRAADRVAEAIAKAAQGNKGLSDQAIEEIIKFEIKASLHPEQIGQFEMTTPEVYSKTSVANLYVSTLATRKLVDIAETQTLTEVGQYQPVGRVSAGARSDKPIEIYTIQTDEIPDNATDVEIPFRMHMTPLSTAGFSHAVEAVDHDGIFTELWHTRMGTRIGDWTLSDTPQPLRGLYAGDDNQSWIDGPQDNWALNPSDRRALVRLMRDSSDAYKPRPVLAQHLRLTALGGSLDAEGYWPNHSDLDPAIDVVQWKHVSSIGRDQFVRVIYDGYLFPFGHAASLIKVSERKFTKQTDGGRVAGLMQKYYIILRQKVRSFPGDTQRYDGRDFPFVQMEITNKQTPDLKAPAAIPGLLPANNAGYDYYAPGSDATKWYQTFWPKLMDGGGDMIFHLIGTDGAGRKTVIEMPLVFVAGSRNDLSMVAASGATMNASNSNIENLCTWYNKTANLTPRQRQVDKALIRFTGDVGVAVGESDYHASQITFEAWKASGNIKGPRFYPRVAEAVIEIPSVKNLLGADTAPKVHYHDIYLNNGFNEAHGANPAQVVFGFATAAIVAGLSKSNPTDKFGGIISPNITPDGLSRKLGALTGVADYVAGAADGKLPLGALADLKLLNIVSVADILDVALDLTGAAATIPALKTVTSGEAVTTTYSIQQNKVKSAGDFFVALDPVGGPQLDITSTVMVAKAGQAPQATVDATLRNFKINLFGFIILNFNSLALHVKPGSKPDCDPKLDPETGVLFGGPLEFLNSFRDLIPMDGFSDPPGIDVTPNGLTASYSLGLPNIGIGALSITNISLGAGFDLPFTGDGPSARFNFAERHNPFNLTVSLFGGGGFFAITLDTGGVRELEACLEFGAQISIDLGVASGGVYVKGGFYFRWSEDEVTYECYIELGGHLSILGLITVSLTFHLGLTYDKQSSGTRLYGTATLTVEIDILFFSISQDVTVERQFAGSDADPSFALFAPIDPGTGKPEVWNTYCDAFA